ncbi:MAG TPA: hypothetical protein PKY30_17505, partial [Myxococcota bacterium]|nr:hypothetical protein [Myxococcota bacterium]
MRILIVGAAGDGRTEASVARAARQLGHDAQVLDALGWRRRLGALAPWWLRWQADAFAPDLVLCTRHAASVGAGHLPKLLRRRRSAFWYFDAPSPLPAPVAQLATLVDQAFATYGYQRDAFLALGARGAQAREQIHHRAEGELPIHLTEGREAEVTAGVTGGEEMKVDRDRCHEDSWR